MWAMLLSNHDISAKNLRVYGMYPTFLIKPFGTLRVYGMYPTFLVR